MVTAHQDTVEMMELFIFIHGHALSIHAFSHFWWDPFGGSMETVY